MNLGLAASLGRQNKEQCNCHPDRGWRAESERTGWELGRLASGEGNPWLSRAVPLLRD